MSKLFAVSALMLALSAAQAAPLVTHIDNLGVLGSDATPIAATETVGIGEFVYALNFTTDPDAAVGSIATIGLELTGSGFIGGFDAFAFTGAGVPLAVGSDLGPLVPFATSSSPDPAIFVIDAVVNPSTTYSFVVSGEGAGATSTVASLVGISSVPVPAAAPLFGAALLGLAGIARRRRAS